MTDEVIDLAEVNEKARICRFFEVMIDIVEGHVGGFLLDEAVGTDSVGQLYSL